MKAEPTGLDGALLITPTVHRDDRGFFIESYRKDRFAGFGISDDFVQHNHSRSTRGVIRGLHFAIGDGAQAKLVRCARGRIRDVIVDLRPSSPTYLQWRAFELDDENLAMLYVPVGFGHGFAVLSETADVVYGCSAYYDPACERTLAHDEPRIGVDWGLPADFEPVLSDRDLSAPGIDEIEHELGP